MARIFLSHSAEDKPWVMCIVHELIRLGHEVFVDEPRGVGLPTAKGIPVGERWYEVLEQELNAVDKVLAIWTPAAAAKMTAGRGEAFSREIFWSAKNRKLVFAEIEQNEAATDESDKAFYDSHAWLDKAPLFAMLDRDEAYGGDRAVREELERQWVKIEGVRKGEVRMGRHREGLGRLQREVLAPEKPQREPVAVSREDLAIALGAIDRSEQVGLFGSLIGQTEEISPEFASAHASRNCHPETVWHRLDATTKDVNWPVDFSPEGRRKSFIRAVMNALSEPIQQARDGVTPTPHVLCTRIAAGKAGVRDWEHVKAMHQEWSEALGEIEAPPNLPVLFVVVLEDQSAVSPDAEARQFTNTPWVRFGRLPAAELIDWAGCDELARLVEHYGFASLVDEQGRSWDTQDWIRDRLERLYGECDDGPTMHDAQIEAKALIKQAQLLASGASPRGGSISAGGPIFRK